MQQGHGLAVYLHRPVDGGDDAVGHGAPQLHAQGVADGVGRVAHLHQVGVAEFRGRQRILGIGLQNGQVLLLVIAHQLHVVGDPGVQGHPAAFAAGDHVGIGDDVPVGGHDDAGADGGAVCLLGHHGDHGGIHLGIYLLSRQGLALGVLAGQAHALIPLDAGDGGGLAAENVHNAAGVVAVAVGQGPLLAAAPGEDRRQHHRRHGHCHHRQGDPQPQAAAALFLFGGLLPDALGHGGALDIVIDHLPALRLLGGIPGDDLLRLLPFRIIRRGRTLLGDCRGLRRSLGVLGPDFGVLGPDRVVFVKHSNGSSHVFRVGWAS